jgi:hypothetical protein
MARTKSQYESLHIRQWLVGWQSSYTLGLPRQRRCTSRSVRYLDFFEKWSKTLLCVFLFVICTSKLPRPPRSYPTTFQFWFLNLFSSSPLIKSVNNDCLGWVSFYLGGRMRSYFDNSRRSFGSCWESAWVGESLWIFSPLIINRRYILSSMSG